MSWQKGPDFLGWVRQPIATRYLRDLQEQRDTAMRNLIGAASVSDDPAVRARCATWQTLTEITTLLENSRKNSVGEDD